MCYPIYSARGIHLNSTVFLNVKDFSTSHSQAVTHTVKVVISRKRCKLEKIETLLLGRIVAISMIFIDFQGHAPIEGVSEMQFWATVCKTVHLLSDRCLSVCLLCLSVCLSVTLVYCRQTVGWIKMKLVRVEVGLGPSYIVLDGDLAPPL